MKKVLYIGAGNPWQGGAGYLVRQNLFLRALAEVADVHLAMFDYKPEPKLPSPGPLVVPARLGEGVRLQSPLGENSNHSHPNLLPGYREKGPEVHTLPSPSRNKPSRIKLLLDDRFSDQPRMIRGYDLAASHAAVAALNPPDFDAIVAFRIDFAHFAGVLDHPRLLLDIDDPEHKRWARRIRATTDSEGDPRTRADLKKLKAFEQSAVGRAKMAFVCNDNDRSGWPKEPIVVPNSVEIIHEPQRRVTSPRVLFVGNCAGSSISPNVDAVRFFLTDIWPLIIKVIPQAQFQLVGALSDDLRRLAEKSSNTIISGFVDDLKTAYAEASISIAPLRFGTGTRIKILESFAHACPVVSTIAGAEGITAVVGKEIEIGVGAVDFANRCIELLQNENLREQIGQAGYNLAASRYDQNIVQKQLTEIFSNFFASNEVSR